MKKVNQTLNNISVIKNDLYNAYLYSFYSFLNGSELTINYQKALTPRCILLIKLIKFYLKCLLNINTSSSLILEVSLLTKLNTIIAY